MISVFTAAALTGIASWAILNRYTARGDYFVAGLSVSISCLWLYFEWLGDAYAIYHSLQLTFVYLVSLGTTTIVWRLSPAHPLAEYPGPIAWRASTLFLVYHSYTGRRHLVLDRLHQQHGKFVRIGPNSLSVCDASELLNIYGAKNNLKKPDSYLLPGRAPRVAMFFKQADEAHTTRKHIWSQAFTPAALEDLFPSVEHNVWKLMKCIEQRAQEDGQVDLSLCLCHWAYDVMGDVTFGGSNGLSLMKNGDPDKIVEGGKIATVAMDSFGLCPWLIEIIWYISAADPMKKLMHLAASMVHSRMAAKNVGVHDIMHYLLEGDPRTGYQISQADLEIDAIVAIQGGSDNTSTTLILAIYFMLCQPYLYHKLRADLERAFEDPGARLDKHTLSTIPLLDAILKEALRFGSPYYLPRLVPEGGIAIADRHVPGGTIISSAAHAVQMSEDNYFPDPRVFRPERWLPGGLGSQSITKHDALSSFTFGPHFCLGKNFAFHEMRMCLSRIVLSFDMELTPGLADGEFYRGLRNMRTTLFDKPLIVKAHLRPNVHLPVDL